MQRCSDARADCRATRRLFGLTANVSAARQLCVERREIGADRLSGRMRVAPPLSELAAGRDINARMTHDVIQELIDGACAGGAPRSVISARMQSEGYAMSGLVHCVEFLFPDFERADVRMARVVERRVGQRFESRQLDDPLAGRAFDYIRI